MAKHSYKTTGTCAQEILFDLEDGVIKNVAFIKGCDGNAQGVARLAEGMRAEELIARLEGIRCGGGVTSCPDQFAKALRAATAQAQEGKEA